MPEREIERRREPEPKFSKYEYQEYGINSRMDAIQAAVLKEKLPFINSWNKRRRTIAKKYTETLSSYDFIQEPFEEIGYHAYHQYCVRSSNRSDLQKHLEKNSIGSSIFY